ncbi:MAG: right-handed parallel beta-helix repeat-containing protein [Thermoplasmatota archaeon]
MRVRGAYWLVAGGCLALAALVLILGSPEAEAWQSGDTYSGSGDWTISNPTILADESQTVNGNLSIKSGGSLTMYNAGVRMNPPSDGGYTISVASGGALKVYDSVITTTSGARHYKFTVYGSLHINYSYISEMWGDTSSWVGGIQLYSGSSATIENSQIYYGKTGGIYINKCSPTIRYNRIYLNGLSGTSSYCYGIYAYSDGTTSASIYSNDVFYNYYQSGNYFYGYGIRSEYQGKNDAINNNYIYDNGFDYGFYTYGYQIYLYYSTPTLKNNYLENGQYQLYVYYSGPVTVSGGEMDSYVYGSTCYHIYATHSELNLDGVYFALTNFESSFYGVYATSYSIINVKNCQFDYSLSGDYTKYNLYITSYTSLNLTKCTLTNWYGSTCYGIYANSYCKVNLTETQLDTRYMSSSSYGIYASYYTPITMKASYINVTDCSPSYYYGSISLYGIYARYYCPVSLDHSYVNISYSSGYYAYPYLIYLDYNSPLTLNWSTVESQGNTAYGWGYTYNIYAYQSDITASNSSINMWQNEAYYSYGLYSYYSLINMNDSRIIADDYSMYGTYGLECGYKEVYIRSCEIRLVRTGGYQWGSCNPFDFWGYWGSTLMDFVMVNTRVSVSSSGYIQPYIYNADAFIDNCTFDYLCTGYSLQCLYTPYSDALITNSTFYMEYKTTESGWGGVFGSYNWDTRRKFTMENCTVLFWTGEAGMYSDMSLFQEFSYQDVNVVNCTFKMWNDNGVYPIRFIRSYEQAAFYFNNTLFDITYGGGYHPGGGGFQMTYLYALKEMNFTNSRLNITIADTWFDDPVQVETFYFEGHCGALSLRGSEINWRINSSLCDMSMLGFSTSSWDPGSLGTFAMNDSLLKMVVTKPDSRPSLLKITAGSAISDFSIAGSEINLTLMVPSSTPTYAIQIIQSDFVLKDLLLRLNAPASPTTLIAGVYIESASPVLKNVTIVGNGQGRIQGVRASLASRPTIIECNISGADTGVFADFFSRPSIQGTEISRCAEAIHLDSLGNATVSGARVSDCVKGVNATDGSWASLTDTSLQTTGADIELDLSSTAWLLNCSFSPQKVIFHDDNSTLIVNWWLELLVVWQNQVPIPGAEVVLRSALGVEYTRALTDGSGVVPSFIVREYTQTKLTKTIYSPYAVNVTKNGVQGEAQVIADRSKRETIVITDYAPPEVAILEPRSGHIQNHTHLLVVGVASDLGSGLSSLALSYDGSVWEEVPASESWMHALEVPEGSWTIRVRATDLAGVESTATVPVVIDLTRPFIDVSSPPDGSLGNVISIRITGMVEPGSTLTVNLAPVSVAEDGAFSHPVSLVEGSNLFFFFARDRAGNTNSTHWTLMLDITPPSLTLTSPMDGLLTNGSSVVVEGRSEPGAVVTINGAGVNSSEDGRFSHVLSLSEGSNQLTVVASDAAGNSRTVLRTVTRDTQIRLIVTEPGEGVLTTKVTVLVRGSTDTDVSLRLNGGLVTIQPDGSFIATVTLSEGLNELVFRGVDRAGNTVELVRRLTLDTTRPLLELLSPVDGALLNHSAVLVEGICEAGINLTVNGVPLSSAAGSFSIELELEEGTSTISVEGRDGAGNEVSVTVRVLVDLTAPALELVEPLDGFRTNDRSVVVVGLTEPGARVTVNGIDAVVDASGRFSVELTLTRGRNTITAEAVDDAGNAASESATVRVVDRPAPIEETGWEWTVSGLLLALGVLFPLMMLGVTQRLRMRRGPQGGV